jgi:hypothetical protein
MLIRSSLCLVTGSMYFRKAPDIGVRLLSGLYCTEISPRLRAACWAHAWFGAGKPDVILGYEVQ